MESKLEVGYSVFFGMSSEIFEVSLLGSNVPMF